MMICRLILIIYIKHSGLKYFGWNRININIQNLQNNYKW